MSRPPPPHPKESPHDRTCHRTGPDSALDSDKFEPGIGRAAEIGRVPTVTVDEIDVTPFRNATAGVYDKLGYGDLRDKLQAIAK